jgi:hypothetical protein
MAVWVPPISSPRRTSGETAERLLRSKRAFSQLAQLQNAIGHKSELRPLAPAAIGLGAEALTRTEFGLLITLSSLQGVPTQRLIT